jgi:hypothetical protein
LFFPTFPTSLLPFLGQRKGVKGLRFKGVLLARGAPALLCKSELVLFAVLEQYALKMWPRMGAGACVRAVRISAKVDPRHRQIFDACRQRA